MNLPNFVIASPLSMKHEQSLIQLKLQDCKNIVLIGAGQLGQMTLRLWPNAKNLPVAFLDSSKTGFISNIPIFELQSHTPNPETLYVICFFKSSGEDVNFLFNDVLNQPIITAYDIFESFIPELFSNGWGYTGALQANQTRLKRVRRHLSDDKSKSTWDAVVSWRYDRILHDEYPIEKEHEKYNIWMFFDKDIIYDVVIDGGSYDLGFYKYLSKNSKKFSYCIAFEPDSLSFSRCLANSVEYSEELKLEKLALAKAPGKRSFHENGDFSARMINHGSLVCDAISIDMYIMSFMKNNGAENDIQNILIKLHIEGAEHEAVLGSLQTLINYDVDLIINLSHNEEALLNIIPTLMRTKNYSLYLRSSSLFGEGLTLFAITPRSTQRIS